VGAAYCAMLLGWLAYEYPPNVTLIRALLPDISSLATILKLFMSFQLQAGILPEYPISFF
jgi:hypothetical protein